MPEGPSIVLAKEDMKRFIGKKILTAHGNAKINMADLKNQKITDIRSWGKHLLICLEHVTVRIHFLMFGTYLINEKKTTPLRLSLCFKNAELNFYTCSVRLIEQPLDDVYDFSADVLSASWNPRKASRKINLKRDELVCDVLLDQEIFAGVGNIIKNEVLFRTRIHPKTRIGKLPPKLKSALVREAKKYSQDFLAWKREFVLKKHWLVYTKKVCPRDHSKIHKEYLGENKRRTFFCNTCQVRYS